VTAKDPQQDLVATATEVSACSVWRIINTCGFHASTPSSKSILTQKHKKSAQIHMNKPQTFWDSVRWSDETKLELFSPKNHQYVWRS